MTEQKLQSEIIRYLESNGCYVVKVVRATKDGVNDLLVCWEGQFVSIECKLPGGKTTALQALNQRRVIEAGGIAFTAFSLEDVKKEFEPLREIP
jgi:Holliday junction resolvase